MFVRSSVVVARGPSHRGEARTKLGTAVLVLLLASSLAGTARAAEIASASVAVAPAAHTPSLRPIAGTGASRPFPGPIAQAADAQTMPKPDWLKGEYQKSASNAGAGANKMAMISAVALSAVFAVGFAPVTITAAAALGVATVVAAASGAASFELWNAQRDWSNAASDPPDSNFKQIASPASAHPFKLKGGRGVPATFVVAANALLQKSEQVHTTIQAYITSIERAQGALAAGDAEWYEKQQQAAGGLARSAAGLNRALGALRTRMSKALQAAGWHGALKAAQIKSYRSSVKRSGFPKTLAAAMRSFGMTSSQVSRVRSTIAGAPVVKASIPFPGSLADAGLSSAETAMADTLDRYAEDLTAPPSAITIDNCPPGKQVAIGQFPWQGGIEYTVSGHLLPARAGDDLKITHITQASQFNPSAGTVHHVTTLADGSFTDAFTPAPPVLELGGSITYSGGYIIEASRSKTTPQSCGFEIRASLSTQY